MPDVHRPDWLHTLRTADPTTPDGELARRFHAAGDRDAFELLVRRHAPTVLRVCRAVVRDPHLAEDAAQAVFLVLARKAGTLAGVRSVAGWLARVAYRAARRARLRASAHPHAPLTAADSQPAPDPDPADAASAADLVAVVLEEIHRLPDRYHAPVVLCCLDGLTQTEAAGRLGWPAGTVAGRLARAKVVLRDRLARRGVALPAAGAALLGPAAAGVPPRFAARVLAAVTAGPDPAVSGLTREVLKGMAPSLRPVARATVALGFAVATVAVLLAAQDKPPPEKPQEKKVDKQPADPRLAFDEALAKEKKFVVVGKVLSADGKTPLEGVEVTASAGNGTLRPTGKTTTDKDGKFRLVFGQGLLGTGGKVLGQAAIVHARKPGLHAWTYGWRAEFYLSDQPLDKRDVPGRSTNLVPGQPAPLEFRMQPAASLRVKLLDGAGKPMAGTRVWLTGENLPPGGSVIADRRTDADGTFTIDDVPRNRYRLVIHPAADSREELELGSIQFRDAAVYEAVATVHEWGPQGTHVSLKVTRGRDR
jgi:RNA polymerase sigma factor (sigma-70 family)